MSEFLGIFLLVAYAMAITALLTAGVAHVAVATDTTRRRAMPARQEGPHPAALIPEEPGTLDLPEVWGHGSFPASDPPANW